METVTINNAQRLYAYPVGRGYSCLGFDYAYATARYVALWCRAEPPNPDNVGTLAGWTDYRRIMAAGGEHAERTRSTCPALLTPELIGLERERVEVTYPDGTRRRFYVGRSGGWLPIHLEISRRGAYGGGGVYFPPGSVVRRTGSRL